MITLNFAKKEPTGLQKVIAALELHLQTIGPDDENYTKLTKELNALYASKKGDTPLRVSPDVLIQAGAGLVAVLLVLHFEKLGNMTSKALSVLRVVK